MFEKKHLLAVGVIAAFFGIFVGAVGHWYLAVKVPRDRAHALAKKQQEEMNRMVRSGEVISVGQDEIKVLVEKSGDPELVGKEVVFRIDSGTTIQQGTELLNPNQQGEKVDLAKYIVPGKKVNVLARDDRALAVHWEATPQQEK